MLHKLLIECLKFFKENGLKAKAVICDMSTINQSLFNKYINVSIENPFFCHNSIKYFTFFEILHILKCLRNNLKNHEFELASKIIFWIYIFQNYINLTHHVSLD